MNIKKCTCCGKAKPETNQFFPFVNKSAGLLHAKCKQCAVEQSRGLKARSDVAERPVIGRVSWLSFTCASCSGSFPHWYKVSGKARCKACETARRDGVEIDEQKRRRSLMVAKAQHLRKYSGILMCPTCGIEGDEALFAGRIKRQVAECKACVTVARRELRSTAEGRAKRNAVARKSRARQAGFRSYEDRLEQKQRTAALKSLAASLKAAAKLVAALQRQPWQEPGLSSAQVYRLRYRLDPEFNLKERMRRQVTKRLKRDGIATVMREAIRRGGESNAVQRALGYTIADLAAHLERQFTPGMTWDRFKSGEIHIDHITPQADFDLSDESEWSACWSLGNLRPLWDEDNIAKSAQKHFLL